MNELKQRLEKKLAFKLLLKWNEQTERWDSLTTVYLDSWGLTNLPLKFGKIKGSFDCSCNRLSNLKSAPTWVENNFYCYDNQITSLEGSPEIVGKTYDCSINKLSNLKGITQNIGDNLYCNNNLLTSLEGTPNKVYNFMCSNNLLTSLEHGPMDVVIFYCNNNSIKLERPLGLKCNNFYN